MAGEERAPPRELHMTPDETSEAVEASGFIESERAELPPYHYAVVFGIR